MGMTRARPWSDDAECWCRRAFGLSSVASLSTGAMMAQRFYNSALSNHTARREIWLSRSVSGLSFKGPCPGNVEIEYAWKATRCWIRHEVDGGIEFRGGRELGGSAVAIVSRVESLDIGSSAFGRGPGSSSGWGLHSLPTAPSCLFPWAGVLPWQPWYCDSEGDLLHAPYGSDVPSQHQSCWCPMARAPAGC